MEEFRRKETRKIEEKLEARMRKRDKKEKKEKEVCYRLALRKLFYGRKYFWKSLEFYAKNFLFSYRFFMEILVHSDILWVCIRKIVYWKRI